MVLLTLPWIRLCQVASLTRLHRPLGLPALITPSLAALSLAVPTLIAPLLARISLAVPSFASGHLFYLYLHAFSALIF